MNTPRALALMWDLIKDKSLSSKEKYKLLLDFDKVFGLKLSKIKKVKIPEKIKKLSKQREQLRDNNQWQKADEIRKQIEKMGYRIEDTEKETKIRKL